MTSIPKKPVLKSWCKVPKCSEPPADHSRRRTRQFGVPTKPVSLAGEQDVPNFGDPVRSGNVTGGQNGIVNESDTTEVVHAAVASGDVKVVEDLLSNGADVEEMDPGGRTPLHTACQTGFEDIVKTLLSYNCTINSTDQQKRTPLHVAVANGKEHIVALLLEAGGTLNVSEIVKGRTPLHEAALSTKQEIITTLVSKLREDLCEAQKLLRLTDKDGRTPLHLAAVSGNKEAVADLLSAGADADCRDNDGLTPLLLTFVAHRGGKRCGSVIRQLLESGAQIEAADAATGRRASHFAAECGCFKCLSILYDRGANLQAQDDKGRSPLHLAAVNDCLDAAAFLLDKGCDLEAEDHEGHRPMHLAVLGDHPSLVQLFSNRGADTRVVDKLGLTYIQLAITRRRNNAFEALVRAGQTNVPENSGEDLIHYCAALGHLQAVGFLIDQGWDVDSRDSMNCTPLLRALNHGHEELSIYLISKEASLKVQDSNGATPLHYAVRWGGSDAILRLLVKKQVDLGVTDRLGRTPLHYAASKFSIMSDLYILLGGGAALDTQDKMGLTSLHLAARFGNESLVRILLDSGARHDLRDMDSFLPIDHALEKDNKSIVKRLREHEAKKRQIKDPDREGYRT